MSEYELRLCDALLDQRSYSSNLTSNLDHPVPQEIKKYLDERVIGQDEAKKSLSVAVYNRNLRLIHKKFADNDLELEKSNVLLMGPTGTGKTLLIKTLAQFLNVPLLIEDASTFTEAGYVGRDVTEIINGLLARAEDSYKGPEGEEWHSRRDNIKALAETGIVYLDEFDKVKAIGGTSKDIGGAAVQEELLKLIEGSVISMPDSKSSSSKTRSEQLRIDEFDTSHVLFICGGSFYGIEELVQRRINSASTGIGLKATVKSKNEIKNILSQVKVKDLVDFGLIPELIGRLQCKVHLNELTEKDLISILTTPKNSVIKQYIKLFSYYGRKLSFTKRALKKIATLAMESRTGARGLRSIVEATLRELQFVAPSDPLGPPIEITSKLIKEN